jgi:4-amino-4-deoxy-L-arabinose transferase-like glycosyltransferase
MALAEFPSQSPAQPAAVTSAPRRLTITLEQLAYLAIFALALLTRLWNLDNRALHHDETLHAYYSWAVFRGQGYVHDPLLHGPFLYFFGALINFLFGDSDATARLGAALFGVALVMLPALLRRELGRTAALLTSVLLLISPAFMYIGRFIRHDPYGIVFELLALIGVVRYISTRRAGWLYIATAALGLMSANMETFYLYITIFLPVILVAALWCVWRAGIPVVIGLGLAVLALVFWLPGYPVRPFPQSDTVERASGPYVCPTRENPFPADNPMQVAEPGPIFGWPPLATYDNAYAICARHQADNDVGLYLIKLGQFFSHPAILAAIMLSLLGVAGFVWQIWFRRAEDGTTAWERARSAEPNALLDALAHMAGGRRWLIALAAFFVPYALLFSSFFTNTVGVISGTTGSLIYWIAQHEVERGGQPPHYYAVLMGVYEPLIALWALVGLVMVAVMVGRARRDAKHERVSLAGEESLALSVERSDLNVQRSTPVNWSLALPLVLAWWTVATFGIYSWAGEKMPWLVVHVALPAALMAGWALARTLTWWSAARTGGLLVPLSDERRAAIAPLGAYLGVFAAIAAYAFLLLAVVADLNNERASLTPWVPLLGLALIGLLTLGAGMLQGGRWAVGALAIGVTLTLALYGVRSAFQLSFTWGDVPREMMIYTQTSPDVLRVIRRLEAASIRRGGDLGMPVWYDNETVWDWYMRRFSSAREVPPTMTETPGPEVMAVLMLSENYDVPANAERLEGFRIQRLPLRWWFPEDAAYRLPSGWTSSPVDEFSPLLMRAIRTPFDTRTAVQFWQYILYRVPPAPLGSTDFVLAVRPEIADEIGLGTGGDQ